MIDKEVMKILRKLKEDNYPILKIEDTYYSANDLYKEDIDLPLTHEPNWDLLTLRLEMRYADGKLMDITCSEGTFTPDQQMEEIRKRSRFGIKLLSIENNFIEYILDYI